MPLKIYSILMTLSTVVLLVALYNSPDSPSGSALTALSPVKTDHVVCPLPAQSSVKPAALNPTSATQEVPARARLAPPESPGDLPEEERLRMEEESLGSQGFQQLQQEKISKEKQLRHLEAERTLYYLSEALGLQLTPDQTALGLNLLSNPEDSAELSADQEVAFLSRKLALDPKQKTKLRDTLSMVASASDQELAQLIPDWHGSIPPELKDEEGEINTQRLRDQAIESLLRNVLSPKQLEDLRAVQDLESPDLE